MDSELTSRRSESTPWDMSDADMSVWNSSLSSAIEVAGRNGVSGIEAIEEVVQCINRKYLAEYVIYLSYCRVF